jgi:hypothetical protein
MQDGGRVRMMTMTTTRAYCIEHGVRNAHSSFYMFCKGIMVQFIHSGFVSLKGRYSACLNIFVFYIFYITP